jgi:Domain of unknown function (DUF4249)
MKKLFYFLFLLEISFFTEGCIDSVTFQTKAEQGFLSVDGTFHNLNDTQFVRLFRSVGYESRPERITGAKISVFDDDNFSANYEEIRSGTYALMPNIVRGQVGKRYHVEIKIGNNIYRSKTEMMQPPIKPDSISFSAYDREALSSVDIKTVNRMLKVLIHTPLKSGNTDAFLRWDAEDSFDFNTIPDCGGGSFAKPFTCYYSRSRTPNSHIVVASSKDFLVSRADGFAINETFLEAEIAQFKDTHYWQVYQRSITEDAYNYWKSIDKVSNQVGSIFDIAPAYVQGNIYNVADSSEKVLGYFEVASVEKITGSIHGTFINQNLVNKGRELYPCADLYRKYVLCCQCPAYQIYGWSNSSDKPSYWK